MGRDLITRRTLPFFFLMLFAAGLPSSAEIFNVTYISTSTKEIRAYNKDDGRSLWQSSTRAEKLEVDGAPGLRITENSKGIWNGRDLRQWRAENLYSINGNEIIPVRSSIFFYDTNGLTVEAQTKTYSRRDGKVYCLKNGDKKTFDCDPDIIDKELLGICLMNYPFSRSKDLEFHMMTNEPAHYKMTMVNLGKDTLVYGDKKISCYKLQMIPDLGFLGIFAPFVPKTYFWYKTEPPHEFVRYEGLESGLNTPYIVMESVNK